jgi:sugar lactone lactonase YvrE
MQIRVSVALFSLSFAVGQTAERPAAAFEGENGPATKAAINDPVAVAVDRTSLFIAESRGAIRRVDLKTGVIKTVPTKRRVTIDSLAVDSGGNLIATEFAVGRVCRISPRTGVVTTVAGQDRYGFGGDGGPAIRASLSDVTAVAVDAANNVYIADRGNGRIRRVDSRTGKIATVAGNGESYSGAEGGSALEAGLDLPNGIAVDQEGNLYISEEGNRMRGARIRRVDASTKTITTIAGSGVKGPSGDGGPAMAATFDSTAGILLSRAGGLYIVDGFRDRIRRIDLRTLIIATVAGTTKGFSGDGGAAVQARLDNPSGIAMDAQGNLYIAEFVNHRVRRVDARSGIIETVAGNGFPHHFHLGA